MSVWTLARSLALTLALEVPFAYAWGLRGRHDLTLAVLVNVLTNPPVVLLYYIIVSHTGWHWLAVQMPLEALAVGVEALCYRTCGKAVQRPGCLSLCANGFSWSVGLLLMAVW